MSDRWVATAAVACAVAALLARACPPLVAVVVVLGGVLVRRPVVLVAGLALLVGGRAQQSDAALRAPLPEHVVGTARLVDDPQDQRFGTQVMVSIDARRYLATVPFEHAGVVDDLLTGDRVRVDGRPQPLQGAPPGWVRSRHLAGRLQLRSVEALPGTPVWFRAANAVHRTVTAGATSLGESRAALYSGLVLGDDRAQTDLMQFRFRAAGLTHLLAVSGQNVAFLLAVLAPLLRRLGPRSRVVAGLVALGAFVLVTRAEPSVLRAAVMAGIALSAVGMGRVVPAVRVLSTAVVVLLVADPLLVHSIGFRLSVAATAGLLFMTRPLARLLPGPDWWTLPVAVTLAAQLATAPILLGLNGGLPVVATPANLLAVPAAGLVMMWGVTVGLVAGLVRAPIAQVVQLPADLLVRWIDGVAAVASRAPLPVLGPGRFALVVTGVAVVLWLRSRRPTTQRGSPGRVWSARRSARVGLTLAGVACLAFACRPTSPVPGRHVLVDGAELWVDHCGARVVALRAVTDDAALLEALWALGVRRVDVVAASGSARALLSAAVLGEQFTVRRTVTTAERAPPGVVPITAGTVTVGGLRVQRGGGSAGAGPSVSEGPCTF